MVNPYIKLLKEIKLLKAENEKLKKELHDALSSKTQKFAFNPEEIDLIEKSAQELSWPNRNPGEESSLEKAIMSVWERTDLPEWEAQELCELEQEQYR